MTDRRALFVRLPPDAADRLDREAATRRLSKAALVTEMVLGRAEVLPGGDVLTPAQAAELLQVPLATVEQLAESGELPGRRIGGEWRFSRPAILAWLAGA